MGRAKSKFSFKIIMMSINKLNKKQGVVKDQECKENIVKDRKYNKGESQENLALAKMFDMIFDSSYFGFEDTIESSYNNAFLNARALGQFFNRTLDRGHIKGIEFLEAIATKIECDTNGTIQHIEDNLIKLLNSSRAEVITRDHTIFQSLSADEIGSPSADRLIEYIKYSAADKPYFALSMVLLASLYPIPSPEDDTQNRLETVIISRILKMAEKELSPYVQLIQRPEFGLPSEITTNIFSFRNKKIKLHGRNKERAELTTWLENAYLPVWAVTGKGGSGKSRLALHFADEVETQQKAKVVWLEKKAQLEELLACDDYSYPQPVLFICDYASHYEEPLKTLIEDMSRARINAKFLLLERSTAWYSSFYNSSDTVLDCVFREESVDLDKSPLSPEDYGQIMQDISAARHGGKQIPDAVKEQLIAKAQALSVEGKAGRCLFLMLLTDEYLRNEADDILSMNATDLLHNYFKHSYDILKKNYNADILDAGRLVLAYATACDSIPFTEMKNHPAVQEDWSAISQAFKRRSEIIQFLQRLSETDKRDTVPAMKPDLLGEFLFLLEWGDLMDEPRGAWLTGLLNQEYSRVFFAMCLSDWKKESEDLCDMLSDTKGDAEQRAACAEVFNLAVRTVQSEDERKEYAAKIKALDHDYSPAVLKEYTDANRFIFKLAAKETRAECTALLNEVDWENYLCTSEKEQQHYADACSDAASVYQDKGNYYKALEFYNKALAIREKVFGTEHPYTATTYNNIAGVYYYMGDYDKALESFQKALSIQETVLGMKHPDIAMFYNNIAGVYRAIGDYDKALESFQKALSIQETALGTEHPDTATTYNNIALVYKEMGDYPNALEFDQKALKIVKKVLGTEHPSTAMTYAGIADVYRVMGDYINAFEYNQKALAIQETVLGTEHPYTAMSYNNIATIFYFMGDYPKALYFYNKALAIQETVLGTEHPDTAMSYNNIASVYQAMCDYPTALDFYNKALAIRENVIGKEHPDTATTYQSIALIYEAKGDYDKALQYNLKALAIFEKVFGTEHPDIAINYDNIASVYKAKGDYVKALEYNLKALTIFEKVPGTEHPDIAINYDNIASVYKAKGDYVKALEYNQKARAIFEKVLGTEHPDTATNYSIIAGVYQHLGDFDNALEFNNKALTIRKKLFGIEHPNTATIYNNIAVVYLKMSNYNKALEFLQKALPIQEKVLGTENPDIATTYNNIAGAYQHLGDYDNALKFYNKALKIVKDVLGSEHPYTAMTYSNIARVYHDKGDYDKALEYAHKAKPIFEFVLGKFHPYTKSNNRLLLKLYIIKRNSKR